jgi:hypothetical protein
VRVKKEKAIVIKPRVLTGTGFLFAPDGRTLVAAADYRFRAVSSGEVNEWGGTIKLLREIPLNAEYVLGMEGQEDDRSGRIRLDAVRQVRIKKVTVYEYTFKGVSPLL